MKKVPSPQNILIRNIKHKDENGLIDTITKEKLANSKRNHYKKIPDSLKYQTSGNSIPNTVNNHIK